MPDNSADYENDEGLLADFDEDDGAARVWNLLWLINPGDEDAALQQFDALREQLGGEVDPDSDDWQPLLREVIDWRAGFHVGRNDIEALVTAIDELAARWNLRVEWGGDFDDEDFTADLDVHALMAIAHDSLREHGYTLWSWNTDGDGHAGWMALSRDDEAMLALCSLLGVEVRPGTDAF